MPTTKQHQSEKIKCVVCDLFMGKYKMRKHLLTWNHAYFAGTLDAYYQQQNNITNKYVIG